MADQTPVTTLYRFYDANDRLLYVGITLRRWVRLVEHQHRIWWPLVARADMTHFDRRCDATAAERAAIIEEKPLYNEVFNGQRWVAPTDADLAAITDDLTARRKGA